MEKKRYERPVIKKLETGMPNKFGTRTEYLPKTHIDGVAVKDLIKGAKFTKEQDLGEKGLAYPIKKENKGFYFNFLFH